MASSTEENYLKALFNLMNADGEMALSDLGRELEVSKPTVNSMMKNLSAKGRVDHQKYKPIKLTAKGKKYAAMIVRKHRLTEMFLVEKMGFGWEEVHDVAEQIEHIQSERFFSRMDEILGFPSVDPHGSPIPDENGKIPKVNHIQLSACAAGSKVRFAALQHSPRELLDFLNSKELRLGLHLEILNVVEFDGSVEVRYHGHKSELLSMKVAESIMVQEILKNHP